MTSQKIKFYKFNSSASSASNITTAKAVEGAIIYIVDVNELWIGGATPKLVLKGANDVTFAGNILTVTHYDNNGAATPQRLDFNDVASAEQTFKVFENVYGLIGSTPSDAQQTLDYSNTNYLGSATTLVAADKALDAAIHDNTHKTAVTGAVYDTQHLSQTWTDVVTANTIAAGDTLDSDIDKLDKKVARLADEVIANEEVTQQTFAAVANSVGLEQDMSLDLSGDTTGIIDDDTSVKDALLDLANYVKTDAGKVDDVQINGTTIVDSDKEANIAVDGTYNASTNKIATVSTVTNAINNLGVNTDTGAASISGSTITINAVQQENGLIKNGNATTINLDGTYDATDNKIATKSTVTNAINNLDVDTNKGAATISGSTITIKGVQQEDGLIKDGDSTTINLDGTYNDTTNKVATQSTVTTAIETLDGSATIASKSGNVVTIKTGVTEADGVISNDTGTDIVLEEVAVTGAAADVSIVDAQSKITATNVEDALTELATNIQNLVGGMRYNGDISSATATLNTSTNDIRPGDIYLASGAFSIGSTSVEAGDMIVYKGTKSTSTVALDNTNCTIIEKETDTMVTAGDTLADDYIVFGNGNKEVTTTSTVDSANYTVSAATLKDAITKANSALQSISHGTDGTYVTTTISEKTNNSQSVGVEVTQSTVAYTAKNGDTPANLTATQGLLNETAIPQIKSYVDAKVGTAVQSVDGSAAEKAKNVTQSDYATVKVTATPDANNNVTLDTAVGLTVQAVSSADSSHKGLAEASDVKAYVDGEIQKLDVTEYAQASVDVDTTNHVSTIKIKGIQETGGKIAAGAATTDVAIDGEYNASSNKVATQSTVTNVINGLDADITSDDAAVATVRVVETDGKITDVVVTQTNAGVNYTPSTASTAADLTASTATGAVTGADIATIKSYVDDKAALCWEEYE